MQGLSFQLSYKGLSADSNAIDLYDGAQALVGFHRSLAITTHLVLNGEVITQAPSLKGVKILSRPIEEGSWKAVAVVVGSIWAAGQAPRDSAVGHLMASAYDYVVSETLGFHVDFDETLKKTYDEYKRNKSQESVALPEISQSKLDAVVEKCEASLREIHRPIIWSKTAASGIIGVEVGQRKTPRILTPIDRTTYEYVSATNTSRTSVRFEGYVSSYNINTFKGRMYIEKEGRPIPFELSEEARGASDIAKIVESLRANAVERLKDNKGKVHGSAYRRTSPSGRLKGLLITQIS